MKVLGRASRSAREGLTDGSVDAMWRRAGVLAVISLALVLMLAPGVPRADGIFQPTVEFETSTTQAAAHPDLRITVDNTASDFDNDIESLSFQLPDGFWGSLDAAVPCKWDTTANNAVAGTCLPAAKIGAVTASAKVRATDGDPSSPESDMTLSGDVFLTDASTANAATDPAGITVVVDAKVGGVDLGKVKVHGRAIPQYKTLSGGAFANLPVGTLGPPVGLKAQIDEIPNEVVDPNHGGRTVKFHATKLVVDLKSDQSPPRQPLLTNPSRCNLTPVTPAVFQFTSSFTSSQGGSPVTPTPQDYSVTNCAAVEKGTTSFTTTLSNPTPNGTSSALVDIEMTPNAATTRKIVATLPSMVQLNAPAYGSVAQRCSDTSIAGLPGLSPVHVFNPGGSTPCPDEARFGTVKIWTPLLPDPLNGYAYWVHSTPIPKIGLWVSPTTDVGNPKGITLSLVGEPKVANVPSDTPSCDDPFAAACDQALSVTFDGIPSAPVSRIQVDTYRSDRPTLDKNVLTIASSGDPRCQKTSDVRSAFYYYSSLSIAESFGEIAAPLSVPGCNQADPDFVSDSTSPIGTRSTDTTPTFSFGSGVTGNCAIDMVANYEPCESTYDAPSALSVGLHYFFFVPDGGNEFVRAFVIDPPSNETTAPAVTFDNGPSGDTADTTPSFTFHADESSRFECSFDNGAFLPCTSTTSLDVDGSYDVTDALRASDDDHTLEVRASDSFGNVGSAATRTFKIVVPFNPAFQVDVSNTTARAHPNLDLTITNSSHEDIKDLSFSLPDGFFGGLTGVASLCPLANADAGTCPASSQVGTVDAEAAIEQSTVRTSGIVYLTEPRDPANEPASLSIRIDPVVQDVVFNDIIVNASLKIRGVAQGIDTFALNLPRSANNQYNEYTEFDLTKMVLKLRTGAGATYPLLTNPSDCRAMAFNATFVGHDASQETASQPFQASGCGALPFAPALAISALDPTGNPAGPSTNIKRSVLNVAANLSSTPDQAGIKNVALTMPLPMTLDVQKLPPVCTIAQQNANACPAVSQVGNVSATSPLLNEPLTGNVYILERNPATPSVVLPRLLIALRGRINVDLVATNSFVNVSQIVTRFDTLPDVPLSSFAINVNNFLTTRNNACDFGVPDWNITGTLTGFNGSASNVVLPQKFDCPQAYGPTAVTKLKKKKSKTTLSVTTKAQIGKKLKKKLTFTLPKGLSFNKAGFTKKKLSKLVTVKVNGKKLKTSTKCFKKTSSRRFQVRFCKKTGTTVSISFRSGTLKTTKKLAKRPKFKMTAVDSDNKTRTVTFLAD